MLAKRRQLIAKVNGESILTRKFCFPPARPGEGLVGTDPAPAGPLAPAAVTCAGAAVTVAMINMTKVVQESPGRGPGLLIPLRAP